MGLAFCGCATTSVREAVGTKYTSDIPPLKIEFAYNIANVKNKWLLFIHNSAKLTRLEMERYQEYRSTLKYAEQDKRFIDILFADLNKTILAIQ